ncbi:MAG: hypothetical protein DRQ97_00395 [Gammaproteobacteria bacterium]|nr:MAG: hypothetical protein DRQ97_00395 [Gammaproteobacteria bacterium]
MSSTTDVKLFFNFRSPYCYIVSKLLPGIFDEFDVNLVWRPLGGRDGRSPPERAKVKIPLVRQDIGDESVILDVGASVGLDRAELAATLEAPERLQQLAEFRLEADSLGIIGVPTFTVGEEIFWGADRVDYLRDHLRELRLSKY